MVSRSRKGPPRLRLALTGGLIALVGWSAYTWFSLPDVRPLSTRNPPSTALIDHRALEARARGAKARRRQSWVPLAAISPQLVDSVLTSEDSRFFQHHGVDTEEMENAAREAVRKRALGRGASTITQQLAKNLWLSGDRSLLRKAKELILTRRLEAALSKQRILQLYLNVVEWGDGVYGAEAAAEEHFQIPAANLSAAQGAILAAMLPAPLKRGLASRSPALARRALWIVEQRQSAGKLTGEEAAEARAEVQQLLAGTPAGEGEDDTEADP